MSANARTVVPLLPSNLAGPRSPGWWGMVLFLVSDATGFVILLASYFYLQFYALQWPIGAKAPDLSLPIIISAALLLSAIAMWFAVRSIRAGRVVLLLICLALAFLFGLAFLLIQVLGSFPKLDFTPQTNVYGSLFWVIMVADAAHVAAGLIWLVAMFVRSALGHFTVQRYLGIQVAALYWYFLFVVWITIFGCLDLYPQVV